MHGAFQVSCPDCRLLTWVPGDEQIDQATCSACGKVFVVERPNLIADRATSLGLLLDPMLAGGELDPYGALAEQGVHPASAHLEIMRVFPRNATQERAYDELTYVEKRLSADLMMYPIWKRGSSQNEPR